MSAVYLCMCCDAPGLGLTAKGALKSHRAASGQRCDGVGVAPRPEEERGTTNRPSAEVEPGRAAAEWVDINSIFPWGDNPRQNDPAVPTVAESIRRFGFGAPIVARKADRMIIAGHTRYKAARQLGLDRVPVRFLDIDPVDAKLLALADNRTAEIADWDEEILAKVLSELKEQDIDLIVGTGFSEDEVLKALGEERVDVPDGEDGDPGAGDGLLDPAHDHSKPAAEAPVLVWRKWRLAMSPADAELFEEKLKVFIEAQGTTFGLVSRMVEGFEE